MFAAHADDAELTLGGTLALLADNGWDVTVAILSEPEHDDGARRRRRRAAEEAAADIGFGLVWPALGTTPVRQVEDYKEYELVGLTDTVIAERSPDVVVTHWLGDAHGDHVRTARAVSASARRGSWDLYAAPPSDPGPPNTRAFIANTVVDVTATFERKRSALLRYNYEGGPLNRFDFQAMERHWAAVGASLGFAVAEQLMVLRQTGLGVRA